MFNDDSTMELTPAVVGATETRNSASGRIAVKVINHLGDEVMKVFRV